MWEHFHHQADIGVRGIGSTIAEAFEQAAIAMTAVICSQEKIKPAKCVEITCQAPDTELLFADWLNAIVYEIATRSMLFARFEVVIDGSTLTAKIWGETVDPDKHELAVEVKAATYTELKVYQDSQSNWVAQCVVDV